MFKNVYGRKLGFKICNYFLTLLEGNIIYLIDFHLIYWSYILALNLFMKAGVIILLNESWLLKYSIINFFVCVFGSGGD